MIHQVLHYAQQPELVIREAARVLDSHGRLLIADFAPHDREELRRRDAHARLGFSDDQIGRWFDQAWFVMEDERTLAGEFTVTLWYSRHVQKSLVEGQTVSVRDHVGSRRTIQ